MAIRTLTFVAMNSFAVWCDTCADAIPFSAFDDVEVMKSALRVHAADEHGQDVGFFRAIAPGADAAELRIEFVCGSRRLRRAYHRRNEQ
ncbi:MAG TPA: hypothetical protein VF761_16820 [Gemmatimonadaceae bacterium]